MASEEVRILAIRGGTLWVESAGASACGGCRNKRSCGQDVGTAHEIQVPPELAARLQVQDTVSLDLPSGTVLRAALSVYVPPMLGLMLGVLASLAAHSDTATLLGGALGLVLGLLTTRFLGARTRPMVYGVTRMAPRTTPKSSCSP